jgi:2-keto-3-deoxy-L-rhamnonate aldolase RhmA
VQYARYPPLGQRGVSPNWPIVAGEDWGHVIRTANDETVLILQIESVEAYQNLDEIAAVPGVDVLFVGPMDLSASLGMITRMGNPEVQTIMRAVAERLQQKGMPVGTTLVDIGELQEKARWGYRLLNIGSPLGYGVEVVRAHVNTLRAAGGG